MYARFLTLIIWGCSIALFQMSCSSNRFSHEINSIDSLISVLDSAHYKLNLLDTAVIQSSYDIYVKNIEQIREAFEEKKDDEVWKVLTRYGLLRKPLRDFQKYYKKFSQEIDFSRMQLLNLKSDIKDNILDEAKIKMYMKEEAEFVKYIMLSVSNLMDMTQNYFNQYLELNPQIEKLLIEDKI